MISQNPTQGKLRFSLWFCRRDLFEKVAKPISLTVVLAVALSASASLVALALPGVTAQVRLSRLAESPLARCVWVSIRTSRDSQLTFSKPRLAGLDQAVRARITEERPGIQVTGYQSLNQQFKDVKGEPTGECKGRTIGPDDPLLDGLRNLLKSGRGFDGPDSAGIVVSPSFVQLIGKTLEDPPTSVFARQETSGQYVEWPVVGVTRDSFPFEFEFLITEAEAARRKAADNRNPQKRVRSGPIGEEWPGAWDEFPARVVGLAAGNGKDDWGIEVEIKRDLLGRHLSLSATDARPIEQWKGYLIEIQDAIKAAGLNPAPGFVAVLPPEGVEFSAAVARPAESTHAAVYVANLDHIRPGADAARSLGFYANDTARALVDEIQAAARQAERVAIGLVLAFCLAGTIVLILALYLRGRQKAAQYGMLRAMGADDAMLRWISVTEAFVLWLFGTLVGIVLAILAGLILCWLASVTPRELRTALGSPRLALWISLYLQATLVACLIGNLNATAGVRRRPASESLGLIA